MRDAMLIIRFPPVRFRSIEQCVGHEDPAGDAQKRQDDDGDNRTRRGRFVHVVGNIQLRRTGGVECRR